LAIVVVGGNIFQHFRTVHVAAAADGLRYISYLIACLIALFVIVCLIVHWGSELMRWIFIVQGIIGFGAFIAWMLDANSAYRLNLLGTGEVKSYHIAIASSVAGVFVSLFLIYIAAALFFQREKLVELVDEEGASGGGSPPPAV